MSLSDSLSIRQRNDKELLEKLETLCKSVSTIDLVSDPSFQLKPHNDEEDEDLTKLSLSHLNREMESADVALGYLDKLWYIRGYNQEIGSVLSFEREEITESELSLLLHNIMKLKAAIETLDDSLIIKQKLYNELNKFATEFQSLFKYFFDAVFDTSYTFRPFLETANLSFQDLAKMAENFEANFDVASGFKQWLHDKQLVWDNLLEFILSNRKYVQLTKSENSYALTENVAVRFSEEYFRSIVAFMNFINLMENQSVKNFYASKISKKLVETISNHIEYMKDRSNSDAIDDLLRVFNVAKETGWHLSLTLDSKEKIAERLNNLYLDWIVEKYVGILKTYFAESFLIDIKETVSVGISSQANKNESKDGKTEDGDDWNNEWDDEEDGWADEVKLDDADLALGVDAANEKINISKVPRSLIEILKSYSNESGSDYNNYLVDAITALMFSSYPALRESFSIFNDLSYLSDISGIGKFTEFANDICSQFIQEIQDEFKLLVFSLNLSHDDNFESLEGYELDDHNLNKLSLLYQAVNKIMDSDLAYTNKSKLKSILINVIDRINYTFIGLVVKLTEITEFQTVKLNSIIEKLNDITVPLLYSIDEPKTSVKSFNKLANLSFLLNNHLKEIMDRFYEAELYDFNTEELIAVIKSVFIRSELRDSYISEIIEARNIS